jgi:hypothetical protein
MSISAGWKCIGAGWALFAVGAVFCIIWTATASHGLLAYPGLLAVWVACYVAAIALFLAPSVADRLRNDGR